MIFCAVVFVSWKTIFLHECMRSFTTRDAWRCGIYPLSQVNFWGSYLKSMRLHLFWPEKTDDISRRHQQSLRELTSKKCVISMKFLRKFLRRQLTTPEIPQQTIMLFVCHVKYIIIIVFSFSWELKWPEKKLKTMFICKIWGDKQRALWYVMIFSGVVN